MITEIQIKDCACFDRTGVILEGLKEINFIYGPNGSGKTTISNVIADRNKYPQCTIIWKNNRALKSFVYNRTFIDDNFGRSRTQKGIFTLGNGEKDAKEIIEAKRSDIEKLDKDISRDIISIEKYNADNAFTEARFTEDCWKIYTHLKDTFKPAFKGCAIKNTFRERCKAELLNTSALLDLAVLKEKAARIYSGSTELRADIALINYYSLQGIETNEIWGRRIIGKEDVDIASMIKKLGNSDWVKQGLTYYKGKDDFCPFCQQKAPENLEQQLREYFDETYLAQLKTLYNQKAEYSNQTAEIVFDVESLLNYKNDLVDNVRLEEIKKVLILKIQANKGKIDGKIKEPASVIVLDSIRIELEHINELIQTARNKIAVHNDTVKNLSRESAQLTGEVWRYVTEQLKTVYQRYQSDCAAIAKTIEGLEMSISENEERLRQYKDEIAKLEILGTNIVQTKTEINALLGRFGFTGFKLEEATEEKGSYQITRLNGERVERTLSEGEKTVITFLYFYHLLKGSIEPDSITADRIVVFDDPVSSLDGDALYLVSHLIRKIIEDIRSGKSVIKQISILTHNVNFHTEVSFKSENGIEKYKDETFWILRKENDFSTIMHYDRNPVKNSYELLWREVKENPDSITLDITLRRIIETWFNASGGISPDELISKLDEKDKRVANSLLSTSIAGTGEVNEDLPVAFDREHYLRVFREIFEKTNHMEHYNRMMGEQVSSTQSARS